VPKALKIVPHQLFWPRCSPRSPVQKSTAASTRHSTSSSARACRASLRPIMPPQAARLDPRDAYCSRNPPPPHLPLHAMRPRSSRERLYPLGLAPPAHSRSQVPPLPSRKPRDASAAAHSPPLSRASPPDRPPSLPARVQESDPLARQSPPGSSPSAEDARERAGGLVSTLTPRRAARRRGSPLSGSLSHSACTDFFGTILPIRPLISFYLCRRAGWRGLRGWVGGRPAGGDCATDPIMGDSPEIFSYPHVPPCTPIYPSFPQTSPCHF